MKKYINKILFVLIALFLCVNVLLVNADDEYEVLKNERGGSVKYYGSSVDIKIPVNYVEKDDEFRGAWVSFYAGDLNGYSNKNQMMNQLNEILDNLEYFNMNSIVFHIRTHNDAYYNTQMAPINSSVDSCDFEEWDYLEWFIDECHKRGIEFHAWLNPYRISSVGISKEEILSKYADFPNNPAHDLDNVLISNDGAILNPGIPEVRDYIVDVCLEIIENYDVDAIHFDDYFYISGINDAFTVAKYNKDKLSVPDFRRQQIDLFIKQLSEEMYEFNIQNNRAVQLGISPTGVYRNGSYVASSKYTYDQNGTLTFPTYSASAGYSHYDNPLYCDTKKWVDEEWIDYIIPQNYQSLDNSAASHAALSDWWDAVVKNKKCRLYIGVGFYKKGGADESGWRYNDEELLMQLRYNQSKENIDGICIYQYKSLVNFKNSNVLNKLRSDYWTKTPANPVVLKYEDNFNDNLSINNLKLYESDDAYALSWDKLEDARRYAVYRYVNDEAVLLGFVGNGKNDFVSFTDNEKLDNVTYAVRAITKANTMTDEKKISSSNISSLEYPLLEIDITISSPESLGGTYMILFSEPDVFFGDKGTFSIYKSSDGLNFDKLISDKEFNKSNYSTFSFNKYGMKEYIKLVITNSMGTFESEVFEVVYNDDADSILDYIFDKNKNLFEDIIGE